MADLQNIPQDQTLITLISEALNTLPEVQVKSVVLAAPFCPGSEIRADFEVRLEVRGHPLRLLIVEKNYASPRDVLSFARKLHASLPDSEATPCLPMLIAPALPMSSREILREQQIAYGDSGGSLYLPFAGALFYIDKPVPKSARRNTRNVYKGKAAHVLHTLLHAPDRAWHVNEMALEAGVFPSTVHDVFQILEEHLWVERRGKGPEGVRLLRDPGAILNAWREEYSLKQYDVRSFYGWSQTPAGLRAALDSAMEEAKAEYTLTLSSGAELVAPFVTTVEKLSVLVSETMPFSLISDRLKLEPVEEGANIHFYLSKTRAPFLYRRRVQEVWVASDIQLYLDLWASPARGKEQAEHLRKEKLSF